jgi:uncharacterized protein (DUF486 family)
MFFDDPVVAFRNIKTSLKGGGRLCMATWQPLLNNSWLAVPGAALIEYVSNLPTEVDGPGMFSLSKSQTTIEVLSLAKFAKISVEPMEVLLNLGATLDQAVKFLVESGPGRAILKLIPEGIARDRALSDVGDVLQQFQEPDGVKMQGAVWVISAENP